MLDALNLGEFFSSRQCFATCGNLIVYSGVTAGTMDSRILVTAPDVTGGPSSSLNANPTVGVDERAPSWTATRNQIAYAASDGFDWEIWTIPAVPGSTPVRVTNNNSSDILPDYRPDGKRIVYAGVDAQGDLEIFRVHRPTGFIWQPLQLTHNTTEDLDPVYSPDEQRIAYSGYDGHDWEIYTMDVFGGTVEKVTDTNTNEVEPSWQPR